MNSALFHMARPGDIRDEDRRLGGGGRGGSAGIREAAAVAKEMGFGPEFGPQVRSATHGLSLCQRFYERRLLIVFPYLDASSLILILI